MAALLGADNIRINAIAPGTIRNPGWERLTLVSGASQNRWRRAPI